MKNIDKLHEMKEVMNINIGICYLAINQMPNTYKYFVNNIKMHPFTKFEFIKRHHIFNEKLFNKSREIYNKLQKEIEGINVIPKNAVKVNL